MKINILTKFHKDWMKTVSSTVYTNKLLMINILTKFHKDWMKTATSIVYTSDLINILTKFHKDWMKTATSIIKNILTKFHKDWMKTVTSTVYTNKLLTDARTHARTHNRRRTSHGHISSPCHFVTDKFMQKEKFSSHQKQLGTFHPFNKCHESVTSKIQKPYLYSQY
ncbi:hypothetical protein DPMN_078921 [Dreissena polymorpha]|uniref:Uncharacterized protein n=1 Tax=Dreissena polymorpha TaxID=45954 RepID=A0A9D3YSR9_DREPO|nr:hypothetical protein DPMN_078921 [Dreissena polymorpha]